jgi:cytoskeletal protein CcmA (bactofilin family)
MWLKRQKSPPIRSLVGEGMIIHGPVSFSDGLRIDGEVRGDVAASGDGASLLVIGQNARVQGKVMARHVIISGEVQGEVRSADMLELQPGARVQGDVSYELLEMHPGARVEGLLSPLKNGDKPALKLAASNDA